VRLLGAGIAVSVVLLASPPQARADDQDYGEHIALADAASVGAFYVANRLTGDDGSARVTLGVGLGSYLLLSPAVHLIVHGREDRAAISFAMRLVPVTVLASTGRCGGGEEAISCVIGHLMLGVVGLVVATAVDVFAVSEGPAPDPTAFMVGGRF
jgi:hypothetical protein